MNEATFDFLYSRTALTPLCLFPQQTQPFIALAVGAPFLAVLDR